MTEEIIIDGVDVSGCTYYLIKDGSCMSQDCECTKCVHNSCYYKDLKLLQNKYDTLTNKFFNSETDKTHLKQENEKLKKEVKQIGSSFIKKGDYARVLEQENKELKADVLKWQKEFSRQYQINENKGYSKTEENYRSALEEIRVIADDTLKVCDDDCGNARKIKLIIDKINECIGE